MAYAIGIDVGASFTAAAVSRIGPDGRADPEPVVLGTPAHAAPSVVFIGYDGRLLVGTAAEQRATFDPDRAVREFKRRLGDDVPLVVAGASHHAEDLVATVVRWVVDQVAEREGAAADAVAITHPASWGSYKRSLLHSALSRVELSHAVLVAEPTAAAVQYAAHARVEPGSTMAVYDLGGGTFNAAVVRTDAHRGFEPVGRPTGIDPLGGGDFDEAVFTHLLADAALPPMATEDPSVRSAVLRVRRQCVEAKEALSSDAEATILVLLPEVQTRVRLVRAEFEAMVRPAIEETIDVLRATVASAGITEADLDAVLLVGGSSGIPLVAQLVSAGVDCPVAVAADPKATTALGAARVAASGLVASTAGGERAGADEVVEEVVVIESTVDDSPAAPDSPVVAGALLPLRRRIAAPDRLVGRAEPAAATSGARAPDAADSVGRAAVEPPHQFDADQGLALIRSGRPTWARRLARVLIAGAVAAAALLASALVLPVARGIDSIGVDPAIVTPADGGSQEDGPAPSEPTPTEPAGGTEPGIATTKPAEDPSAVTRSTVQPTTR